MLKLGPEPTLFSAGVWRPLESHIEADNHPLQDSTGPTVFSAFTPSLLLPVLKQDSILSITINAVHEKHALILAQHPLRSMAETKQK